MSSAKPRFVTSMSGNENIYFTIGSTKDAALFQDRIQKLAQHVSIATCRKQVPILCKAITNLRDPVLDLPSRPVRKYYKTIYSSVTTDLATGGTKNVAVMDDLN